MYTFIHLIPSYILSALYWMRYIHDHSILVPSAGSYIPHFRIFYEWQLVNANSSHLLKKPWKLHIHFVIFLSVNSPSIAKYCTYLSGHNALVWLRFGLAQLMITYSYSRKECGMNDVYVWWHTRTYLHSTRHTLLMCVYHSPKTQSTSQA